MKTMLLFKYLNSLWRTLRMPLIDCEINLDLNWSKNCIIAVTDVANQVRTFSITATKLYVLVITSSSTQDNGKILN